jgi:hypothetical protein
LADRNFRTPTRPASEEHVGEIDASDQQHGAAQAHEHRCKNREEQAFVIGVGSVADAVARQRRRDVALAIACGRILRV